MRHARKETAAGRERRLRLEAEQKASTLQAALEAVMGPLPADAPPGLVYALAAGLADHAVRLVIDGRPVSAVLSGRYADPYAFMIALQRFVTGPRP